MNGYNQLITQVISEEQTRIAIKLWQFAEHLLVVHERRTPEEARAIVKSMLLEGVEDDDTRNTRNLEART